jgi:cell division septal protein FtsQ
MKPTVKRPARRRSQTRLAGRRPRRPGSYASIPFKRVARHLLPSLGMQRGTSLFVCLGLAILLTALMVMPDYTIKEINIKGNLGTPSEDLQAAAGFARGSNAFLLRTSDVVSAVMTISGVQKAEAHVNLPGRLEITVTDARPDVLWQTSSQTLWVDSNGTIYDRPPVEPERKLTVKDVSGRVYRSGDQIDKTVLATAQQISITMPHDIQGFEFQREGELTVVSNQGWSALFNTRADLQPQMNALHSTLNSGRTAGLLDVRVPNVVSVSNVGR